MTYQSGAEPRLLVVEDEPELAEDTVRALADLGYGVVGRAQTGLEGIEFAGRLHPDLVLMDIRLPGAMDGRDAARLIDEMFDIPTVFATGVSAREEILRAMGSTPYGYLLKPYGHRELLAAVELALHLHSAERERREREIWFERILERQRDLVAVVDASGIVDYVSPPVQEVLGRPPEAVVDRDLLEHAHPEDRPRLRAALAQAFAEPGGLLDAEGRFRTEWGAWRHLRLEGRMVDPRGDGRGREREPRSARLVVEARAIPETSAGRPVSGGAGKEEPLRPIEETVAGTFRTSESGTILAVNPALARMLGYESRHELVGQPSSRFLPDRRTRARLLAALRRGRSLTHVEVRLRTRSGAEVFGLLAVQLVHARGDAERFLVGTVMDITERKRVEHELERLAFEDPLTGLVNRRALSKIADRYLALARRQGSALGLIYLDLARFKQVNDRRGHAAGDEVLREVARRLTVGARDTDVACRLGGDEFVVLLPDLVRAETALEVARRVERELERPIRADAAWLRISGDMGVAVYPDHGLDFEVLLRAADRAMYRAKAGRHGGRTSRIAIAETDGGPPVS